MKFVFQEVMVELVFESGLYYCVVYLKSLVEENYECEFELRIEVEEKVGHNFDEVRFVSEMVV